MTRGGGQNPTQTRKITLEKGEEEGKTPLDSQLTRGFWVEDDLNKTNTKEGENINSK